VTLGTTDKAYAVILETFDSLSSYWINPGQLLKWECLFVLPAWLEVWWSSFGEGLDPYICTIRNEEELIGIAPLLVEEGKARFIGSPDVCDYQDFVVAPGKEEEFFPVLIEHLSREGITQLDLGHVRPDSTVLTGLASVAKLKDLEFSRYQEAVSFELELPATWDEFLQRLTGKHRHEIRRKLRRLHEAAHIEYRLVEDVKGVKREMDTFLKLFESSRSDKAVFMTDQMAFFFRSLAEPLAEANITKLFFLDLDGIPFTTMVGTRHSSLSA
jgi:CelD/BcsL family acetyltransferase involved in cellulose biosynthesis